MSVAYLGSSSGRRAFYLAPRPVVGRGEIPKCGKGVQRVASSKTTEAVSSPLPVFPMTGGTGGTGVTPSLTLLPPRPVPSPARTL